MQGAKKSGVVAAVLGVFAAACTHPQPASMEEPAPSGAHEDDAVASAKPTGVRSKREPACLEFASAACDMTSVPCAATREIITIAGPDPEECAEAHAALREAQHELDDAMLRSAVQGVLGVLVRDSGRVSEDELARYNAARPAALKYEISSAELGGPMDETTAVTEWCPGSANVVGAPSDGAMHCARADGTRHGPAVDWSAAGDPIRVTTYRAGKVIAVRYYHGVKAPLSPDAFICPDHATRRENTEDGARTLSCETADGGIVGTTVTWRADGGIEMQSADGFTAL